MMKKIRRNEKGTVLLTVICFTTMCMVIAAIALRVSNKSNTQSNENVMRSQAQITAEHYLEQYLSTFPTAMGDDGVERRNYDGLKDIAGSDEDNATRVTISIQQSENITSQLNISDGTLANTSAYGGNCSIYVYKAASGGYVVKAVGNYGGQEGSASAFFHGDTPATNLNKNAIETCGAYKIVNSACVSGDVLLEFSNQKSVTFFENNNGVYNSNFKTQGNLFDKSENLTFGDTLMGNAPTITAEGSMAWNQLVIKTDVGKTDATGKHVGDSGYDITNLRNKNGYVSAKGRIFFYGNRGNKVGTDGHPIDVYCSSMSIGKLPDGSEAMFDGDASRQYKYSQYKEQLIGTSDTTKLGSFVYSESDDNTGPYLYPNLNDGEGSGIDSFYGNIYIKARTYNAESDTVASDLDYNGDLTINNKNKVVINGDVYVDGNIYINNLNDGGMDINGTLYYTGEIYGDASRLTAKNKVKGWPTTGQVERATQPDMNYAPGLFVQGTCENPTITSPTQTYLSKTPAKMYKDNSEKTKYFATNFAKAIAHGLGDSYTEGSTSVPVCPEYATYGENVVNKRMTIQRSCYLTEQQVYGGTGPGTNGNDGALFTVKIDGADIWILLPAKNGAGKTVERIPHLSWTDNSTSPPTNYYWYEDKVTIKDVITQRARFYVETAAGDKHHCYFAFYNCDNMDEADMFYTDLGCSSWYTLAANASGTPAVFTNGFGEYDGTSAKNVPGYADDDTNIVYLIPDGFTVEVGDGGFTGQYQATFYGPLADVYVRTNTSGNKVFGQIKANKYYSDGTSGLAQAAAFADLREDSILHTYLTSASAETGSLTFQYYIKHK